MKKTAWTLALAGLVGTMSFSVSAEPITGSPSDPSFEKVSDGAIAEFRGNGNNTSWSIATGSNTQDTPQMDNAGLAWEADTEYDWSFSVDGDGVSFLEVWLRGEGERLLSTSVFFDRLTDDQLNANTLEIHAKGGVSISLFNTAFNDPFTLSGDPDDRFGVDFAYLGLSGGLANLDLRGTIMFSDPIANQAGSGVTFKAGNTPATVPEPGVLALLGLGLLGLAAARRRNV